MSRFRRKATFGFVIDALHLRAMNHFVRTHLPKFFLLTVAILLQSCGGTDRRHSVTSVVAAAAPAAVELRSEASAATIHFPAGIYQLDSEDRNGYYYRAPGKVYERTFAGRLPHDGGIFVSKRNQRKLRGYVVMPGGVTHVGNLSGANYQFRY
jgi:hypothetical protein